MTETLYSYCSCNLTIALHVNVLFFLICIALAIMIALKFKALPISKEKHIASKTMYNVHKESIKQKINNQQLKKSKAIICP